MARSRYEVVPDGDQWKLTGPNGTIGTYDTKEAVDVGEAAGTFGEERTYPRSSDPYPPPG